MKTTFIYFSLLISLFLTTVAIGQNNDHTRTFNYNNEFNYEISWAEKKEKFSLKISANEKQDSFTIQPLELATFTTAFIQSFKNILPQDTDKQSIITQNHIIYQSSTVFYYIQLQRRSTPDYRPKAGTIRLAPEVAIFKFTDEWNLQCNEILHRDTINDLTGIRDIQAFLNAFRLLVSTPEKIEINRSTIESSIRNFQIKHPVSLDRLSDSIGNYYNLPDNQKAQMFNEIRGIINEELSSPSNSQQVIINREQAKLRNYRNRFLGKETALRQYRIHLLKDARKAITDTTNIELQWINRITKDINYNQKNIENRKKDIEQQNKLLEERLSALRKAIKQQEQFVRDTANNRRKQRLLDTEITRNQEKKRQYDNVEQELLKNLRRSSVIKEIISSINLMPNSQTLTFNLPGDNSSIRIPHSTSSFDTIIIDDLTNRDITLLEQQAASSGINQKLAIKNMLDSLLANTQKKIKTLEKNKTINDQLTNTIKLQKDQIIYLKIEENEIISDYFSYFSKYNYIAANLPSDINTIEIDLEDNNSIISLINDTLFIIKETKSEILEKATKLKSKDSAQQPFTIDSVQVEFYEGVIEHIWIMGHLKNAPHKFLKFENRAPIQFSNKKAYDKNKSVWLVASEDKEIYWVLYLGDILTYIQNHDNGTKDFSPANGVVTWKTLGKWISLYKKPTSKILEAHVFSDFVGFGEQAPNGLVQTEVSKRFNIYTRRYGSFLRKNAVYCRCNGPLYGVNVGFLNFITPSFIYSKFEEKQRNLFVNVQNDIINNQLRSIKFVSTHKMLQHEIFNVGTLINLVTLDIPLAQSILYLNIGTSFGRTELTDSIYQFKDNRISAIKEQNYGMNTLRIFSEIAYKATPQKRYGVGTAIRFIYMRGFLDHPDPFFQWINANQIEGGEENLAINQWMVRFEASGFFRPVRDSENKLFLRYRFHGQLGDLNYNFHQLQVGTSFYLLRNNITQKSRAISN